MTTICYRDGVLAADSLVMDREISIGTAMKFLVLADNSVVAAAGILTDNHLFFEWAEAGFDPDKKPELSESFEGVHIGLDEQVTRYVKCLAPEYFQAEYFAIGTGFELALGAMAVGATAEEACEAACKHDTASGGPVRTYSIKVARRSAA